MEKSTEVQYLKIFTDLASQYSASEDLNWQDNPLAFCEWFLIQSDKWSKSTARLRKNALIYSFGVSGPREASEILSTTKSLGINNKGIKRTSQRKAKKINGDDFQLLIDYLSKDNQCKYDQCIALWLISGFISGARPSEWFGAQLIDDRLTFRCAKNTHNRSCGEYRTVIFTDEAMQMGLHRIVSSFLDVIDQYNTLELFDEFYQGCRKRLLQVNKKLWPKRNKTISLYSTRHQFSANAKAVSDKISVAALMGHRSQDTAGTHYLQARFGDPSKLYVTPDVHNMNLVNGSLSSRNPFNSDLIKK